MEDKPVVSVLMGSHNPRWDRLRRGIKSLQSQTLENWELILWDDGSSPAGAMILEQAAQLDSRVRLYHGRENRGLGYGLNRCMERARGNYLARLDDDDVCFPRRFELQTLFLEAQPGFQWVGSGALLLDESGVWGQLNPPECPGTWDFLPHSPYIHPSVMFRRETLEMVGGYSQSPAHFGCEDYHLFFRLHSRGWQGYNLEVPLLGYWEDRDSYRRRTVSRRLREAELRWQGYRMLHIPTPVAGWGTLRPLAACLVPGSVLSWAKRWRQLRE